MSDIEQHLPLPPELQNLSAFIDARPECLAVANTELHALALSAAKFVFDWALQTESASRPHLEYILSTLTESSPPQTRSQTRTSTKRKHGPSAVEESQKISLQDTPLPSLFTDGMNIEQIWEQLELRAARICDNLQALDGEDEEDRSSGEVSPGSDGEESQYEEDESTAEADEEDSNVVEVDESSVAGDDGIIGLQDETSEEDHSDEDKTSSMLDVIRRKPEIALPLRRSRRKSELDDGFFDLADFNAETEEAEAQSTSRGGLNRTSDFEDSEGDESDVDFFQPVDDVVEFDQSDLKRGGESGGGELYYKDFFDPPQTINSLKKGLSTSSRVRFHEEVKVKKIKARGKGRPVSSVQEDDSDEEDIEQVRDAGDIQVDAEDSEGPEIIEDLSYDKEDMSDGHSENDGDKTTIERLRDDLFAEDEEPRKDMTSHEQRLAALQFQIRELEAENVAKKDWVLMGEASSKARPHDSLLQEDLEFERAAKAAPVVTEEVVQNLEARIKARISESRFDDVVRRRPMDDKPFLPSKFFELQDTKSAQSLAQIYEGEFMAAQTGTPLDDRDGKLKKEHDEITRLWDSICNKLDALCNAHYVPKQPTATISTVSDLPAASLESALPVGRSAASMLAPEEIFAPVSPHPWARSELTPGEKRALRAKERKARKKSRDILNKSVDKYAKSKSIKQQKEAAVKSIVKSGKGVTVVGKHNKTTGKMQKGRSSTSVT
ncbi:Mpp10 protein [Phlebopus sp. FC_14]|nr:Mpp10 protein [Phlebopus sp. FC_14]